MGEARLPEIEGWVIAQSGQCAPRTYHAEVELPGWTQRPWVAVRALTDREALERESIGVQDVYGDLIGDGQAGFVRTYDFAAMAEYDLGHSVVDFWLPRRSDDGDVEPVRGIDLSEAERAELLRVLPAPLGQWMRECVDRVNLRRLEDAAALDLAQKN